MRQIVIALFLLLSASTVLAQSDSFDVFEAGITDIQQALESGQVSSAELVRQYLARIETFDQAGPTLNSIVSINAAAAEQAMALDRERATTGPRSKMHGIPILVKDNYNVPGMNTSGGSVALANFQPSAASFQVQRLIDAGAIVLGKTNLHEFAYGITTVGSLFGQTLNPYDIRRVPGGSSGGTGAAIAASLAAVGLGSDTCGSIRIPSAFNNLVGLRPTKGLSSIHGVMPLSHTQDVAGPLARSAEDLAIVLDIVSGFDGNDPATALVRDGELPSFVSQLNSADLSSLRLGRLDSYFQRASGAVRAPIDNTLEWLEQQGAEIVAVSIPGLDELVGGSGLISLEFRDDLANFLQEFGSTEVTDLATILEQGLYHEAVGGALERGAAATVAADDYASRMAARQRLREAVLDLMRRERLDAIVYPTIGELPVRTGEPQNGSNCSLSANSGLPAISVPVGFSSNDLPVGLELLGAELADSDLLAIAHALETHRNARRAPAVTPSLNDGAALQSRSLTLSFSEGDVQFQGQLLFEPLRNVLAYELSVAPRSAGIIHAITLSYVAAGDVRGADPIVHNLLTPAVVEGAGEYFMSGEFRQAFAESRVYLRIFARGLPAQGISWWP